MEKIQFRCWAGTIREREWEKEGEREYPSVFLPATGPLVDVFSRLAR